MPAGSTRGLAEIDAEVEEARRRLAACYRMPPLKGKMESIVDARSQLDSLLAERQGELMRLQVRVMEVQDKHSEGLIFATLALVGVTVMMAAGVVLPPLLEFARWVLSSVYGWVR